VAAARSEIGKNGVSGVTVVSVCTEAGVGRTSFYNYFADTDALITEVATEAATGIKDRFDQLHKAEPKGRGRLRACIGMILTLSIDDREFMLLVTSLAQSVPAVAELLETEIIAELSAESMGGRDAVKACARHLAITTIAVARHLAEGRIPKGEVDRHVDFLMRSCG